MLLILCWTLLWVARMLQAAGAATKWTVGTTEHALARWSPWSACQYLCLSGFHPGLCVHSLWPIVLISQCYSGSVFLAACVQCVHGSIHLPIYLLIQQTSHHPTVFTGHQKPAGCRGYNRDKWVSRSLQTMGMWTSNQAVAGLRENTVIEEEIEGCEIVQEGHGRWTLKEISFRRKTCPS